ncbi:DUF5084 family protein [Staphylococcus xylosus]|uniref:DUF5084 domain-containing protein n=1 Tax=Staphylococcus xylosus TaxID=1288 RepID=A0AAQ0LZT4_STAXY|nr:DUF5084 family protein [Staphylococcus xylosus]PTI53786.1 DUF5084 domain-containing protein [Staphylococcus xylosus]PTI54993.1 DUF5084 domain-containing protein [Staphylococcus xylosus]RIM66681.1 DUF5084 domain-containing protein [Staphylococcus xylosus]RIM92526.1 DUF5084 domain-containing protein [Staphylococcus xylosus]
MNRSWWIVLAIGGILCMLSVNGFILGIGCFAMIALNAMWLVVYTPKRNKPIFENVAKPTIYISIIGTFSVITFMGVVFQLTMNQGFNSIGEQLYGNIFHSFNLIALVLGILLYIIGTCLVFKMQYMQLKK